MPPLLCMSPPLSPGPPLYSENPPKAPPWSPGQQLQVILNSPLSAFLQPSAVDSLGQRLVKKSGPGTIPGREQEGWESLEERRSPEGKPIVPVPAMMPWLAPGSVNGGLDDVCWPPSQVHHEGCRGPAFRCWWWVAATARRGKMESSCLSRLGLCLPCP